LKIPPPRSVPRFRFDAGGREEKEGGKKERRKKRKEK